MGFLLGFGAGLFVTIGLLAFVIYWLCTRSNTMALARVLNGVAQALAHRPKAPEPLAAGNNGEATEEGKGTRRGKER